MEALIDRAVKWIALARKTVALTGAGASTESGIPDFRSADGLWSRYNPAEYATLGAFLSNPAKVWRMLAELEELIEAKPNAGHQALAHLEKAGAVAGVITQNIDGLHQAGGSRTVVEFHGSSRTFTCLACAEKFPRAAVRAMPRGEDGNMPMPPDCARRESRGARAPCVLKPDVVFFDEMIPLEAQAGAARLVEGADLIIVAGTSCEVYPAAGIPHQVRGNGGRIIEINLQPEPDLRAELVLQGSFSEMMSGLWRRWSLAGN